MTGISLTGTAAQLTELAVAILLAPLLTGWVNQCRAWLQNKSGPGLLRQYLVLRKLFAKDAVVAHGASPVFRMTPYVLFGCMAMAAAIVPTLGTDLPYAPAADAIALVGILALARVFLALAGMDIGTAFGTLGARREMMIGFLAEPALLMVLFNAFLLYGTTALPNLVDAFAARQYAVDPGTIFAAVAFLMVLLAENARIPIDNPA